jgi:hypothetical protein
MMPLFALMRSPPVCHRSASLIMGARHHHAGSVWAYVLSGAIRSQNSATSSAKVYRAGESFIFARTYLGIDTGWGFAAASWKIQRLARAARRSSPWRKIGMHMDAHVMIFLALHIANHLMFPAGAETSAPGIE